MAATLFEDIKILVKDANLGIGSPGPRELEACSDMMLKASQWRFTQPDAASLFQYGARSGHVSFRKELSSFLTKHYGDTVNADDLVVCGGATSGLAILTSFYFSAGDVVFVEDSSYFLALTYFKSDVGLDIVCVPTDESGMIPSELERLVSEHSGKFKAASPAKPYRALVYNISTYHNPTGRCIPAERCSEIVRTAKANELLVVCDDVYNLLPFSPKMREGDFSFESSEDELFYSPLRLLHFDKLVNKDTPQSGNVVSVGTFSKVLAPGMRLGWLEGSQQALNPIRNSAFMASGGAVQQVVAGIAEALLHLKLQEKHLAMCRVQYEKRAKALCRSFKKHLPAEVEWKPPAGGYFIWLRLPDTVDGMDLKMAALKEEISVTPGIAFSPEGKWKNFFRVCYTYEDEDDLEKAGETLGRLIRELM